MGKSTYQDFDHHHQRTHTPRGVGWTAENGQQGLRDDFRALLQNSPDVSMLAITQEVLEHATNLRVTAGLKTPDAIHAATALLAGCALFVTNDSAFQRVAGLPMGLLSEAFP